MKCPNCGRTAAGEANFCPECGADLTLLKFVDSMRRDLAKTQSDMVARFDGLVRRLETVEQDARRRMKAIADKKAAETARQKAAEAAPEETAASSGAGTGGPGAEKTPAGEPAKAPAGEAKQEASGGTPAEPKEEKAAPDTKQKPPPLPGQRAREFAAKTADGTKTGAREPETAAKPKSRAPAKEMAFGQKWLLIIGVVVTVLGIAYFLKYAFDNNWVGPAGRVALAYATGLAGLGLGEWFRRRYGLFGLLLIGGGIATLYFSSFAAFQIYGLVPQWLAFTLMVIVTVLAWGLSIFHDTMWLAVLGIVGGFLTPVVLSTGVDNQIVLMTYMTILNLGVVGIAGFKRWPLLNYLGFLATWGMFTGWYIKYYEQPKFWPTIIYCNIFFLAYTLAPFFYYLVREHKKPLRGFLITVPNAFIGFGYSYAIIKDFSSLKWVSLVTLGYSAISSLMAHYVYRRNKENIEPFVMLIATSTLFLVITVPVLFSGHWITVFWAVQAAVLLWAAVRLRHKLLFVGTLLLFALTLGKFMLWDYDKTFKLSLKTWSYADGFSALLLERWLTTATVLGSVYWFGRKLKQAKDFLYASAEDFGAVMAGGFALLLFWVLNVEVLSFFRTYYPAPRPAMQTAMWMVFAAVMMWLAARRYRMWLWLGSIILLGVGLVKFVFYDYVGGLRLTPQFAFRDGYTTLLAARWTAVLVVVGTVVLLAALWKKVHEQAKDKLPDFTAVYKVLFWVMLFIVLNLEVSGFCFSYVSAGRFAAISILWGCFAVALMVIGFARRTAVYRRSGMGVIAATLLKVFLFDMQNVHTPYRIMSFVITGIFLIGVSFLYHKYKHVLMPPEEKPEAKAGEVKA
ncbi:MAG: DUF2339 domain-containing protein [Planctomycetes bacterium]|nr:DUF2339 domain-containing protein [Planctomycetota bacterium]